MPRRMEHELLMEDFDAALQLTPSQIVATVY
jgi:hypothetical protein